MKSSGAELDPVEWLGGRIERALLEVVILTLWRMLTALGAPVRRFLSFFVWSGISVYRMARGFVRLARRLARWMACSYDLSWVGGWCPKSLRRYHFALAALVLFGVFSTILRKIQERFDAYKRRRSEIKVKMTDSKSYAEWSKHFAELRNLDTVNGRHRRNPSREAKLYGKGVFKDKTVHLKEAFEKSMDGAEPDVSELVMRLREDMVRKLGNMQDSYIYEYFGEIPEPIREYLEEVKRQLNYIASTPNYPVDKKLSFLQETRHAFGRTALLLSGGGALGAFHLGVVKALLDNDLLPRIIGGSSVGSIVSAIIGAHTDSELREMFSNLEEFDVSFFSNSTLRQFLAHLLMKGHLQDENYLINKLKGLMGELTFLEAYEKTGRVLNVVVCAADTNEPPRVLNYLTAPQVLVWSAVAASSAFPGLFPARGIRSKNSHGEEVAFSSQAAYGAERRWRDGSLEEDLPLQTLRELFNVNYFMVSQTNPHIVPMLNFKNKFERRIANAIEIEWKHRCQQLQWLLPDWIPSKWLSLFSQSWEGDVTMVLPAASYWTLRKAIVNPTQKEVLDAARTGELETWPKLSAIQSNCVIERTLDKCLSEVMGQMKQKRAVRTLKSMKSRIPSWLHMPVLGMPNVESIESLLSYDENSSADGGLSRTGSSSHTDAPVTPQISTGDLRYQYMQDCLDESASIFDGSSMFSDVAGPTTNQGLDFIAP